MKTVEFSWLYCNFTFQMKELAASTPNPRLFTVATLTGHAVLAVGEGYSVRILSFYVLFSSI